ncbi:MAG TPA: DUF2169 domain-containing protein, partial [Polyangiaceae bacterium]|nr:DUF2169 domain-containing protein [Polyangiaceae bacterium]
LADGTVLSYPENPVGSGWIPPEAPKDQPIAAPQLLAPGELEHRPGQRYAPQSLAPVPPNWEPRLSRAGTFDERWLEERWPVLPADFDYSFYQSAHPDLIYPSHVRGDERIELVHFFRDRAALSFLLPGYEVFCLLRFASGLLLPLPAALDTIFIDVSSPELEDHRVSLTWRACLPSSSIAIAEARMLRPGESPRREAIGAELIETELRRMMHGGA